MPPGVVVEMLGQRHQTHVPPLQVFGRGNELLQGNAQRRSSFHTTSVSLRAQNVVEDFGQLGSLIRPPDASSIDLFTAGGRERLKPRVP